MRSSLLPRLSPSSLVSRGLKQSTRQFSALITRSPPQPSTLGHHHSTRPFILTRHLTITAVRRAKMSSTTKQQLQFSAGSDAAALEASLTPLLKANGGRWNLTMEGEALEREFKFKTFAKTWVRIQFNTHNKKRWLTATAGLYDGRVPAMQAQEPPPGMVQRMSKLQTLTRPLLFLPAPSPISIHNPTSPLSHAFRFPPSTRSPLHIPLPPNQPHLNLPSSLPYSLLKKYPHRSSTQPSSAGQPTIQRASRPRTSS
jgi:hypothetical protein